MDLPTPSRVERPTSGIGSTKLPQATVRAPIVLQGVGDTKLSPSVNSGFATSNKNLLGSDLPSVHFDFLD
jgi:hypothetical protein